jgi:RNA polymerase sigma-B factor
MSSELVIWVGAAEMTISPTEAPPRRGAEARPARGPRDRRRETLLFSRYGESRDPALREHLVERYLPLARTIARRYQSPRVPTEDLVQVAAIGLMKAIDRYDPARGIAFSSYAVPTMVGEVQRHFRDHTWGVRPPRDLQERAQRVIAVNRALSADLGRPPSAREIAERLRLSLEEVVEALQACDARDTTSLDRPRVVGEETDTLADTIGLEDREYDRVDHAITADLLMAALDAREREVLRLRFHEDLTQSQIGERVGCSQMHVSRLVRGALAKLAAAAEEQSQPG